MCLWNNANMESSKQLSLSRTAGMLSTNRPHIHSAACWFILKNQTEARSLVNQHSQSTVTAIDWLFPSSIYLFWFLLQLWAPPPFSSVLYCSSFLLPSIRPVTPWLCFQAKWERVSAWWGVEAGGGGLGWSRQGHFCYWHKHGSEPKPVLCCTASFSASHGVIEPPFCPSPFSFPNQVCPLLALTLSKLVFWLKEVELWSGGALFHWFSSVWLSGEEGGGGFFVVLRLGGGGHSAGVTYRLLWLSKQWRPRVILQPLSLCILFSSQIKYSSRHTSVPSTFIIIWKLCAITNWCKRLN